MTRFGGSYPSETTVEVGLTHVTLREPSGRVRVAGVLDFVRDAAGEIVGVLLDRLVHERYGKLAGWDAGGCFVTELSRHRPKVAA